MVAKVFEAHGFRYPVEFSFATVGVGGKIKDFPYIKPSHFIEMMSKTNDLNRLLAGFPTLAAAKNVLAEFWERWRIIHPHHDVFNQGLNLQNCVPLFLHGDEGQHYKKSAVLITSFQPVLGYGSKRRSREAALPPEIEEAGIPLNFLRTAFQSRFLTAVAPKDCRGGYSNHFKIEV